MPDYIVGESVDIKKGDLCSVDEFGSVWPFLSPGLQFTVVEDIPRGKLAVINYNDMTIKRAVAGG